MERVDLVSKKPPSLEDLEAAAAKVLHARFPELGLLVMDTYRLLGDALKIEPAVGLFDVPPSGRVCRVILTRLGTDLRVAYLAAGGGYPMAVATLAASAYEVAYQVGYIGADDGLADKWAKNENKAYTIVKTYAQVLKVLRVGRDDVAAKALVDQEQDIYHQLCGMKHGNSYYQRLFGYRVIEGEDYTEYRIEMAPDSSDRALRATTFALHHMLRWCLVATDAFARSHGSAQPTVDLGAAVNALVVRNNQLIASAAAMLDERGAR